MGSFAVCQSRQEYVGLLSTDGNRYVIDRERNSNSTSCRRAAATICPPISSLRGSRSALHRRADGNVARVSHGHRCSRPTRQHGVEQSGLVTLTLEVVSESHVTWATSVSILVFLGLSVLDLGPMYASDRRQTASSLYAPAY